MSDYEATRFQYEGYSAHWNADRPATGLVYWMLNNAWPGLHWNQFDVYLHPAGAYYGTKTGSRLEHAALDHTQHTVHLINHSLDKSGPRTVLVDVIDLAGQPISNQTLSATTEPNTSKLVGRVQIGDSKEVVFVRLSLVDDNKNVLSRNVYWVSPTIDELAWANSTWSFTPVTSYADFTSLNTLNTAEMSLSAANKSCRLVHAKSLVLENKSTVPAFFIRLNLVGGNGEDVLPVFRSENYVTLWPGEKLTVQVEGNGATAVEMSGWNVKSQKVAI